MTETLEATAEERLINSVCDTKDAAVLLETDGALLGPWSTVWEDAKKYYNRYQQVPDVSEVTLIGGERRQLRVTLDPARAAPLHRRRLAPPLRGRGLLRLAVAWAPAHPETATAIIATHRGAAPTAAAVASAPVLQWVITRARCGISSAPSLPIARLAATSSLKMASARTVAVVVPSPAASFVLVAASFTS